MAFLDNSGDIILDAVLTDHGRKELARGDGSFNITKFALGDDEINYARYNLNHSSGSSYYDLEIIQTPILEAFTDNAASMKSKLVTYENLELLFLPVLKLYETGTNQRSSQTNSFVIAVDEATEGTNNTSATTGIGYSSAGGTKIRDGIIFGESLQGAMIQIDQGLDTTQISARSNLQESLIETEFIIQLDGRLGSIVDPRGAAVPADYTDDDGIAYYTINASVDEGAQEPSVERIVKPESGASSIAGPRGFRIMFRIQSSLDLQTSNYLFTKLGSTSTLLNEAGGNQAVYHIDSLLRVTGVKTGYSVDIPLRFAKLQ